MARNVVVLGVSALAVGGIDLVHKAAAAADPGAAVAVHPRSMLYVVGVALASSIWAGAILLTRSVSIAVGGGILLGGAAGNLASLALFPGLDGVPNPLAAGEIAFNLADASVAVGVALVVGSSVVFAGRNRERLHEPVRLRA
jgi:lipoprotein signal peptidase